MPVGYVSGYALSEDNQTVKLFVNIKERYRSLVTKASKFWNIGGIDAEFGIFKGLKVETTNLESLVQGGIAFSTPVNDLQPVRSGFQFELYEQEPDK
ncbi:hypothetical protein Q4508_11575 [Amphritea sp. 2_MG-2023]|uniref:hypothetical protein n=1 Tax=Amphritea TaxID=515417 RepID=UPI001C07D889|nr:MULTISPECIES: hypothetical protein [Amphritea]MBU2963896.1 hypothetical protein [Amphritea atlantica]MDO6419190.1 hypothetical protein [Amphritea sp. 2_MG-2023]